MDSYVRIFDTTLRDGEQSPGATMTSAEKLEVARMLQRLGVDVIEAGFPAASPDDLAAVQQIASWSEIPPMVRRFPLFVVWPGRMRKTFAKPGKGWKRRKNRAFTPLLRLPIFTWNLSSK